MSEDAADRMAADHAVVVDFTGEVWHWRGPSPFYFVTVPEDPSSSLAEVAPAVSYGWGMVPASVRLGATRWDTALFPKDGHYVLPLKDAVRRAEEIDEGDVVTVQLTVKITPR